MEPKLVVKSEAVRKNPLSPSRNKLNHQKFLALVWTGQGPIMVFRNQFIAISNVEVKLMRWYHHCYSYDFKTGDYEMLLDGEIVAQGTHSQQLSKVKGS